MYLNVCYEVCLGMTSEVTVVPFVFAVVTEVTCYGCVLWHTAGDRRHLALRIDAAFDVHTSNSRQ